MMRTLLIFVFSSIFVFFCFEWECNWYVVTKWKLPGFTFISGTTAFATASIIVYIHQHYFWLILVNIGASRAHKNK